MSKLSVFVLLLVLMALIVGAIGLGLAFLETKTLQGTVIDENGAPISQAALTVAGRSTFSNAQGFFEIQFPRGEWELRAFADGYQEVAERIDAADLWAQNFSAALTLDARLWRGRVVAVDSEAPIANATVEVEGKTLATNGQGEFVVAGLRNGTRITISQPGYRTVSVVVQSAGDKSQTATIALARAETRVLVVDASNEKPLSGAKVMANGTSLNTDAEGAVTFFGLTEGTTIAAQAPGYAGASATPGKDAQVTLRLEPTTLYGHVVDAATKASIGNAVLLVASEKGVTGGALASDARGKFTIQDWNAVPTLYVKKPGYRVGVFDLKKGGAQDFTLTPFDAKGIHLYYGIQRADAERILDEFKGTEMNAVVFDVKESPGYILWDSKTAMAQKIGAYLKRDYTAPDEVETCRTYKLYCIARVTVFKDVLVAKNRPDLALHNAGGGLLYENDAYWTNPSETEVQNYHIGLAQELAAMGFDEVQFDYIRFPGTAGVLASEFGGAEYRVKTIADFLQRASDALRATPAFFSGDVFGLTTAIEDEQGIGQVWEEVAPPFDYISPMMYPSTWRYATNLWGNGFGIKGCADAYVCPYDIMRYGTLKAKERTTNDWTLVRPWLQAYQMNLGTMSDQARGADDAKSAGYLFWNNLGVYPAGLFRKK